ncbi:DUF3775 domain-containing protein [Plastoroseomonas arctica]|uniref:DUF3775 domain-containing protein n=1 Tax=Plastoroseomonas arctica TaxID=1509237 RepID=A0AAF1JYX3_9PROT|nr:DUF3775 domain-containing protein [Plastoroseomonas arctica]MBR0657392.1 DUF3775 domain-containing protein [Plastoroseomonas arctica]
MAEDDDANEVDLGISLESVAAVVDQMRALQIREEPDSEDAEEDQNSEAALLTEQPDDQTLEMLEAFIGEMNTDEQISLIALAWVGRGDYGPDEWAEARRLAAERDGGGRDPTAYLLDMDNLADLLSEGVAAFGLSIEDVER